jgi:hypothetical protein
MMLLNLVLDFYKLNDESREMVDVINLMNDPKGFMDVYKRNYDWMNNLWLKRGDYYRDIVTQELSDIEDNGLLNFWQKRESLWRLMTSSSTEIKTYHLKNSMMKENS